MLDVDDKELVHRALLEDQEARTPIERIIAVSDKLSCAANLYLCTKARAWLAAGGDPTGEYMEHLAQLAEKNQKGGNDRGP